MVDLRNIVEQASINIGRRRQTSHKIFEEHTQCVTVNIKS
jgi:hypothetical protein